MTGWSLLAACLEPVAQVAAVAGLVVIVFQLHVQSQATRIQTWSFVLDASNRRWTNLVNAKGELEKKFALGEVINFHEVIVREINHFRLPKSVSDDLVPHITDVLNRLSFDPILSTQIRELITSEQIFSELRQFAENRAARFGEYEKVAQMLRV
jgi:hypothetical protein